MGRIAQEFREEMSRSLYESYLAILNAGECATQYEAIERARRSPAPQWFISEWSCVNILTKMQRGEPTGLKNPDKIRKYDDLFAVVERWRAERGEWPGLIVVCREIVHGEAPEYYICHNTAKQMILAERKRRREEVARRWVR